MKIVYNILVGKPEERRPLGRNRRISEDNIKVCIKSISIVIKRELVSSEDYCLLFCDRSVPTFRTNMLPSSSGQNIKRRVKQVVIGL
jgi:hypothetical protein